MTVLEPIQKRYSCRAYLDKPIEQHTLDTIFEAARLAPSAKNLQDWRFVAVTDKKTRKKVAQAANNQLFLENASVIIVACTTSDYQMLCGQKIGPIDISIALEHIALQAAALGLATCWIGSFEPDKIRNILQIPENIAIIELMALGHPAEPQKERKRLPLDAIVCYEKWLF